MSSSLVRAPSGLSGPALQRKEPTAAAPSGGFRPKKSSPDVLKKTLNRATSTGTLGTRPEAAEVVKRSATGLSGGGFRPRPELLAQAQAALKEMEFQKKLSKQLSTGMSLDDMLESETTPPEKPAAMTRRPSGMSGPGMLQKTPSSTSGAFRPRKVNAPLPVAAPAPAPAPAPSAKKAAEEDYDPTAQYARDMKWFARSYGTLTEATDEKKLENKHQVNTLLRGKSSKLTREILDEDETASAPPAALTKALSVKETKNGNGHVHAEVAAVVAAKDKAIAELTLALAASEKRTAQVVERLDTMQTALSELAATVRASAGEKAPKAGMFSPPKAEEEKVVAEPIKKEEDNPMAGMMKGLAGLFGQGNQN